MDKIQLLQERKAKIINASKEIRDDIFAIVDEGSFVELSAFSFSKNDFYGENAEGEGVVTGYATIEGYPYYIVAQNFNVFDGGVSKASCDKIVKCLDAAEKNAIPVVYFLNTHGVQVGEGVTVLEGVASVLAKASQLNRKCTTQYVIVNGEVYGAAAMLAAIADFTFFVKKSVLAINSPFVLSAKAGKNLTKEEVGGAAALNKTGLVSFEVETLAQAGEKISMLAEIFREKVVDAELNESLPALNEGATAKNMLSIFDSYIELCANYEPEIKTVLGRIGGISVAAVVFDDVEDGVELTVGKMEKLKSFAEVAYYYDLPFVTFTNTKGICPCACANNSRILKTTAEYLEVFNSLDAPKVSVVYKKAIGLGYSLFASKSIGFDYSCAFANAKIALFDTEQGAQIEFGNSGVDKAALAVKYADENSDPINAAKGGYIDAIIEPQFVKQYLIASLQMLIR